MHWLQLLHSLLLSRRQTHTVTHYQGSAGAGMRLGRSPGPNPAQSRTSQSRLIVCVQTGFQYLKGWIIHIFSEYPPPQVKHHYTWKLQKKSTAACIAVPLVPLISASSVFGRINPSKSSLQWTAGSFGLTEKMESPKYEQKVFYALQSLLW